MQIQTRTNSLDPHLQNGINSIEKVQRKADRFITGDYSPQDQGCVTQVEMLQNLDLSSLPDRRKMNRLVFFYKVVDGLVLALQCHDILTPIRVNVKSKPDSILIV